MNNIKVLPSNLINQIAAGEVVERPASVVKELIENSIDANSTNIEIIINDGGKKIIQVIDNGIGMSKSNLNLSFKRHATSKITSFKDLSNINTLGFRGEALPSIASVSQVVVQSKLKKDEYGNEMQLKPNSNVKNKVSPCMNGTNIVVKDLFYNLPARKKFLKSNKTEYNKITSIIRTFSLLCHNISFKYISNNKIIYNLKPDNLLNRIIHLYKYQEKNLLKIDYNKDKYNITGYLGDIALVKKRPGAQYIFINDRYIENRLLKTSIHKAFSSLVDRGEYPFYVINIKMPIGLIDCNVHPGKLEVRFQDEWRLYHVLKSAITLSLKDIISIIPSINKQNVNYNNNADIINNQFTFESIDKSEYNISKDQRINDLNHVTNNFEKLFNDNDKKLKISIGNIWQILNKYIITEVNDGLLIIDQHVAHERILYEETMEAINNNGLSSQTLLFPETLNFQPDEYNKFLEIYVYIKKIGYKMRQFGNNTMIIEGVPSNGKNNNHSIIIKEILDNYIKSKSKDSSFLQDISSMYACKAAVKAGDKLELEEMASLINRLFSSNNPYYCPHGRPILMKFTEDELDRRFERK